jgi:hypothetical protein
MPKEIKKHCPNNFTELLEIIEDFQDGSKVSWYRGCRNKNNGLIPSLYRHKSSKDIEKIGCIEADLTSRFVQRSIPFVQRSLGSAWDKMFFMQHYGIPTRLLDWSENPFVAIYFSLLGQSKEDRDKDACIWMCNPADWNKSALRHISFQGGILDQENTIVRAYAPDSSFVDMPNPPIMMYGAHNSPRIVAQRGVFALFGKGLEPIEKIFLQENYDFPNSCLEQIIIEKTKVAEMRDSLFRKGITESVVFPDLDGLAKELRRIFEF